MTKLDDLRQQLADSQAREEEYRTELEEFRGYLNDLPADSKARGYFEQEIEVRMRGLTQADDRTRSLRLAITRAEEEGPKPSAEREWWDKDIGPDTSPKPDEGPQR